MKWSSFGPRLAALAAGVLLVGMLGSAASAVQYPPPTGNVSLSASNATPAAGASISISATAVSQFGTPASGLSCTFQIVSQPGSSAFVDTDPKVTDADGMASTTLNVGTTAGMIVVGANCGELSSHVTVQVRANAPAAPAAPIEPAAPAAPAATTLRLPPTGTGPEGSTPDGLFLIATLGLLCVAAGSALRITAKQARRSR